MCCFFFFAFSYTDFKVNRVIMRFAVTSFHHPLSNTDSTSEDIFTGFCVCVCMGVCGCVCKASWLWSETTYLSERECMPWLSLGLSYGRLPAVFKYTRVARLLECLRNTVRMRYKLLKWNNSNTRPFLIFLSKSVPIKWFYYFLNVMYFLLKQDVDVEFWTVK